MNLTKLTQHIKAFCVLVMCILLTACATNNDMYYWGKYESMLQAYYSEFGLTPEEQIMQLQTTIDDASKADKSVAPGIYAHLGVAYADLGQQADAEAAFAMEISLYPESQYWLESMMQRTNNAVGTQS